MAVTIAALDLAAALRAADGTTPLEAPLDAIFSRLLGAVATVVETYAPDAPDAIQNEAAIRFGGWLYDAVPGRSQANGMDLSGARALLGPYRVRRALPLAEPGMAAGVTLDDAAIQAAIDAAVAAHRAIVAAHHAQGSAGVVNVTDGRLPAGDVVMRLGWRQSQDLTDSVFTRADDHPTDGAAEGESSGLNPPVFPPGLNTDPDLYLFVWVAAPVVDVQGILFAGDNASDAFSDPAAYTYDGTPGSFMVSNQRLSAGAAAFAVRVIVAGVLIAKQSDLVAHESNPQAHGGGSDPVELGPQLPTNAADGQLAQYNAELAAWLAIDTPVGLPVADTNRQIPIWDAATSTWVAGAIPATLRTPVPDIGDALADALYRTDDSVKYRRAGTTGTLRLLAEDLGGGRYGFSVAGGETWSAGGRLLPDTPEGLLNLYFDDRLRFDTDGTGILVSQPTMHFTITPVAGGAANSYTLQRDPDDAALYAEPFAALDPESIFADGAIYDMTIRPFRAANPPLGIHSGALLENLIDRYRLLTLEGELKARIRAVLAEMSSTPSNFSPVQLWPPIGSNASETFSGTYQDIGGDTTWNTYSWLILDWGPTAAMNATYLGGGAWVRVAKLLGLTGTRTWNTVARLATNGQYILIKSFVPTPRTIEEEGFLLSWDNSGGSRNGRLLGAITGSDDIGAYPLYVFGL